jgi:hypothetical protein
MFANLNEFLLALVTIIVGPIVLVAIWDYIGSRQTS